MKNQKILNFLLFLAISTAAISCKEAPQVAAPTKSYKTMTVSQSNSSVFNQYTASIRGAQFVDIRPQVSGVITNILFTEGAKVNKGQTLFIIDQAPYKSALAVAKANVKSAEAAVATATLNAESAATLNKSNVISNNEFQITLNALKTAEANLSLTKAQLASAKNNLSYTVVKSPVNGVASMINYRVGALVSSSIAEPLVSVSNSGNMHAYFSMSESQILSMVREYGSTQNLIDSLPAVDLILNDGENYLHKGRVDAISGTIDKSTGTVSVRAIFENPEQMLRDGGNGRISIETTFEDVIIIPKVATYEIQNKVFVYKVIDGKATSEMITVYPTSNSGEYVVTSGLNVGDVIIAEGAGLVREGTEVK